jgi:hypothetical protein
MDVATQLHLREILRRKSEAFLKSPRGFRDWEEYFKRNKIAVWHTGHMGRRKKRPPSELYVDLGGLDNLPYKDKIRVDLIYTDGTYTYVFPADLAMKVVVLGEMPP